MPEYLKRLKAAAMVGAAGLLTGLTPLHATPPANASQEYAQTQPLERYIGRDTGISFSYPREMKFILRELVDGIPPGYDAGVFDLMDKLDRELLNVIWYSTRGRQANLDEILKTRLERIKAGTGLKFETIGLPEKNPDRSVRQRFNLVGRSGKTNQDIAYQGIFFARQSFDRVFEFSYLRDSSLGGSISDSFNAHLRNFAENL